MIQIGYYILISLCSIEKELTWLVTRYNLALNTHDTKNIKHLLACLPIQKIKMCLRFLHICTWLTTLYNSRNQTTILMPKAMNYFRQTFRHPSTFALRRAFSEYHKYIQQTSTVSFDCEIQLHFHSIQKQDLPQNLNSAFELKLIILSFIWKMTASNR